MIAAFVLAALAGAAVGLPVDYLRRRFTQATATVAGLVNAAAVIAVIALIGATDAITSAAAVAALVLGVVAGNAAADATATAVWGPAKPGR